MTELEQHREAYGRVVVGIPGSQHISHEDVANPDWERPEVHMPPFVFLGFKALCPICGDPKTVKGLTQKCRDWHEVCQCGARYDRLKNPGCRRRKHPKVEKS